MVDAIALDPVSQTLIKGKQAVRLRPTEFQLLSILLQEYPSAVHTADLKQRLWGHRKDGGPEAASALGVTTFHLRRTIDRLGLTVAADERRHHTSYKLEFAA